MYVDAVFDQELHKRRIPAINRPGSRSAPRVVTDYQNRMKGFMGVPSRRPGTVGEDDGTSLPGGRRQSRYFRLALTDEALERRRLGPK
jgi:hypothetical protein